MNTLIQCTDGRLRPDDVRYHQVWRTVRIEMMVSGKETNSCRANDYL